MCFGVVQAAGDDASGEVQVRSVDQNANADNQASPLVLRDVAFDLNAAQLLIVVGPVRGPNWPHPHVHLESYQHCLVHVPRHMCRWEPVSRRCCCICWER